MFRLVFTYNRTESYRVVAMTEEGDRAGIRDLVRCGSLIILAPPRTKVLESALPFAISRPPHVAVPQGMAPLHRQALNHRLSFLLRRLWCSRFFTAERHFREATTLSQSAFLLLTQCLSHPESPCKKKNSSYPYQIEHMYQGERMSLGNNSRKRQ